MLNTFEPEKKKHSPWWIKLNYSGMQLQDASVVRISNQVHPHLQLDIGRPLTQYRLVISYIKTVSVIRQRSVQCLIALNLYSQAETFLNRRKPETIRSLIIIDMQNHKFTFNTALFWLCKSHTKIMKYLYF